MMTRRTHARRGTTLVELLVAASMSILVMWLLTWCYQQGLGSFTATKAQGDLMDSERQVTSIMTRDLTASHFLPDDTKPNQGLRVSDQSFVGVTGYVPPIGGYFRATSAAGTLEGADGDGFNSWLSSSYSLQFTSILPGGPPQSVYSAEVPFGTANPIYGRAAELAYFLVPNGQTPNGTPLFNLIRRQRLCAMTSDDQSSLNQSVNGLKVQQSDGSEVMAVTPVTPATNPATLKVFTLGDLTTLKNRLFPPPTTPTALPITSSRYGEDVLMSNVLSFEVKFTGFPAGNAGVWPSPFPAPGTSYTNTDYPYDNLPTTGVFDTSNPTAKGQTKSATVRVTGAMIRLRAYAPRTQITRQTTFIVSL